MNHPITFRRETFYVENVPNCPEAREPGEILQSLLEDLFQEFAVEPVRFELDMRTDNLAFTAWDDKGDSYSISMDSL